MHFSTLATLFLSASFALSAPTSTLEERTSCVPVGISNPEAVVSAFKDNGVVPELIPRIAPVVKVRVTYDKPVRLGNTFTTAETTPTPTYSFSIEPGHNPFTTTYSLFMIDQDAPYLHWYVSGNSPSYIPNECSEAVAVYQMPRPPTVQPHRYAFLVYREPPNYTPDSVADQDRLGFDVNTYARQAGLVLVGGNFFLEGATRS